MTTPRRGRHVASIRAVCKICGPFDTRIHLGIGSEATFVNSRVECPKCGRVVQIPDGIYEALNATMVLIRNLNPRPERIEALRDTLQNWNPKRDTERELQKKIEERVPEFVFIQSFMPSSKPGVIGYITALVSILGIIISAIALTKPAEIRINWNEIQPLIERFLEDFDPGKPQDQSDGNYPSDYPDNDKLA